MSREAVFRFERAPAETARAFATRVLAQIDEDAEADRIVLPSDLAQVVRGLRRRCADHHHQRHRPALDRWHLCRRTNAPRLTGRACRSSSSAVHAISDDA
jgi:hypothetical protein